MFPSCFVLFDLSYDGYCWFVLVVGCWLGLGICSWFLLLFGCCGGCVCCGFDLLRVSLSWLRVVLFGLCWLDDLLWVWVLWLPWVFVVVVSLVGG